MTRRSIIILCAAFLATLGVWYAWNTYGGALFENAQAGGAWLLPVVVFAALLDSINPCALSVLFISIAVLFSLGKSRKEVLTLGSVYIFGVFAVYVGIGLVGLWILGLLAEYNIQTILRDAAAAILILVGLLSIVNVMYPAFPVKLKIPQSAHPKMAKLLQRATVPGALLLGALVSLYEFPCTGGPYMLVITILNGQGTFASGFGLLILYNLIFVAPLIVILAVASDPVLLEKAKGWKKEKLSGSGVWAGAAMIILGILILII